MERELFDDFQSQLNVEDFDIEGYYDYVNHEYDNEYEQHAHSTAERFLGWFME